jgi:DNA-directed RNA polymerase subunit RPC12/RpoP
MAARKKLPHPISFGELDMTFYKCTECGNTFKIGTLTEGQMLICPVCEATYLVSIKDGKVRLEDFIYENEDLCDLPN